MDGFNSNSGVIGTFDGEILTSKFAEVGAV